MTTRGLQSLAASRVPARLRRCGLPGSMKLLRDFNVYFPAGHKLLRAARYSLLVHKTSRSLLCDSTQG